MKQRITPGGGGRTTPSAVAFHRPRLVSWPLVLVPVIFLSSAAACVSTSLSAEDPASASAVLRACSGGDESFCRGFIEATVSSVLARAEACPPPITVKDAERIVVAAIRQVPPDEAAILAASAALRSAWPCPPDPESNNAANAALLTAALPQGERP